MQIGIDSFAANEKFSDSRSQVNGARGLHTLLRKIRLADEVGLDVFGVGEHYREDFLDSAPSVILGAAAAVTEKIRLCSAVKVLGVADPVRVFQEFATLDLISNGRAEIVVGRGSFTEAFPLFGYAMKDYDAVFKEKLDLLLKIRDEQPVTWSGQFRPPLDEQSIFPRPLQQKLPIWLGVGGSPDSFERAGAMGLPLMIAIIGGETHRFRPLVDLYKEAWQKAGHPAEDMAIGIHSPGYIAETTEKAVADYYPGYADFFGKIGRERGWAPITYDRFLKQNSEKGAFLVGSPKEVADKILRHSEALGGVHRFTFQMDNAGLETEKVFHSIELIGKELKPLVSG